MKKAFTLIETLLATLVISFIFLIVLININFIKNQSNKIIHNNKYISLWIQWENLLKYYFNWIKTKIEKEQSNYIKSDDFTNNTQNNYLSWRTDKSSAIKDKNGNNYAFNELSGCYNVNASFTWFLTKIDCDYKKLDDKKFIPNFNIKYLNDNMVGPLLWFKFDRVDSWIKKDGKTIYNYNVSVESFYKDLQKPLDYTFNINVEDF